MIHQDKIFQQYLMNYEPNVDCIGDFSQNISEYITQKINIELASEIDQHQNFEVNFINSGVDFELDLKTELIKDSEDKLEAIRKYLNDLIPEKSKGAKESTKTYDLVKIHETEKTVIV